MQPNSPSRAVRFLRKSRSQQAASLWTRFKRAWRWLMPTVPLLARLPGGGWWLVRDDVVGDAVFSGTFELAETAFVRGFVQPGMTVFDVGANAGYYTLMASRMVGQQGRVIAFEPSPRERQRLLAHLRLNRCPNVRVESTALSSSEGSTSFFVVSGRETGCNSIRPPDVAESVEQITVPTITLDRFLETSGIAAVDFMKLDVEGAELDVLRGGAAALQKRIRPVLLCELEVARTRPWGYEPEAILHCLSDLGYVWLGLDEAGRLVPMERRAGYNVVAVPTEKLERVCPGLGLPG